MLKIDSISLLIGEKAILLDGSTPETVGFALLEGSGEGGGLSAEDKETEDVIKDTVQIKQALANRFLKIHYLNTKLAEGIDISNADQKMAKDEPSKRKQTAKDNPTERIDVANEKPTELKDASKDKPTERMEIKGFEQDEN